MSLLFCYLGATSAIGCVYGMIHWSCEPDDWSHPELNSEDMTLIDQTMSVVLAGLIGGMVGPMYVFFYLDELWNTRTGAQKLIKWRRQMGENTAAPGSSDKV